MKEIIQHPTYGEIVYEESFWTGKRSLIIGGAPAEKRTKTEYVFGDDKTLVSIKGNYLYGISLVIKGETIEITPKPRWYEIAVAAIPVVLAIVWGNSPVLCAILPMLGGALGGGLGALFGLTALMQMKKQPKLLNKLLIGLGIVVAWTVISVLVASALVAAMMQAAN
jgi:hypothetical protein